MWVCISKKKCNKQKTFIIKKFKPVYEGFLECRCFKRRKYMKHDIKHLLIFTITIICIFILNLSCKTQAIAKSSKKNEIQQILKDNPEIIFEILEKNRMQLLEITNQAARERVKIEQEKQIKSELKNPKKPEIGPNRPILGNPDAPITIVEYSDFLCSYCAIAARTIKNLRELYPDKVRIIFKHKPANTNSLIVALYFEAIAKQNPAKAWEFADKVFAQQDEIENEGSIINIALSVGVNKDQITQIIEKKDLFKIIEKDKKEASKFGIKATPVFLVNGIKLTGAVSLELFDHVISLIEKKTVK